MTSQITAALLAAAIGMSAGAAIRSIDNPRVEGANNSCLDFRRIELTDTSTVVKAHAHFRPHWWIRLAPTSFLECNGNKYQLKGTSGIVPDEQHYMPDSGEDDFYLYFDPIDTDAQSVTFREGDDDGWTLWNISLTDSCMSTPPEPSMPQPAMNGVIPQPEFRHATSTVNIKLMHYHPSMGQTLEYGYEQVSGPTADLPPVAIAADGTATVSIDQRGPACLFVRQIGNSPVMGQAMLQPGENIDLTIDCAYTAECLMSNRPGYDINSRRWCWQTGDFADFAHTSGSFTLPDIELFDNTPGNYHMTDDEYTDHAIERYTRLRDSIAGDSGLDRRQRELARLALDAQMVWTFDFALATMIRNFMNSTGQFDYEMALDSIGFKSISAPNLQRVANLIDLNDSRMLLVTQDILTDIWEEAGIESQLAHDLSVYRKKYDLASKGKLSESDLAELQALSLPFFAEAAQSLNQQMADRLSKADRSALMDTPAATPETIFDEIIAPHRGKIVVVDLWNTWCGPCRSAIGRHEPDKQTLFDTDDIVWIYIADDSSPELKYFEMIPGIKGLHYRLDGEQMAAIRKRFAVDGIPYYIVVDREGNAAGRPDLRDDSLYKSTLLEMLK